MQRILGIDPGLRLTGYGCIDIEPDQPYAKPIIVEAGVLRLDAGTSIASRLAELYRDLSELIKQTQPESIIVEKLYAHYAHPTTAIKMGHARGVILLAAQQQGVLIHEVAATAVKKAIVGHGHAGKEQVQLAIQSICGLPEPPSPNDVADALAIAITGARHRPDETALTSAEKKTTEAAGASES